MDSDRHHQPSCWVSPGANPLEGDQDGAHTRRTKGTRGRHTRHTSRAPLSANHSLAWPDIYTRMSGHSRRTRRRHGRALTAPCRLEAPSGNVNLASRTFEIVALSTAWMDSTREGFGERTHEFALARERSMSAGSVLVPAFGGRATASGPAIQARNHLSRHPGDLGTRPCGPGTG